MKRSHFIVCQFHKYIVSHRIHTRTTYIVHNCRASGVYWMQSEPKTSLLFCMDFQCLISLLLFRPVHGKWCSIHIHETANIVKIYTRAHILYEWKSAPLPGLMKSTLIKDKSEKNKTQKQTNKAEKKMWSLLCWRGRKTLHSIYLFSPHIWV